MAAEPQPALVARKKIVKVGDEATAGTHSVSMAVLAENLFNVECQAGDFFSEGQREPDGNYLGRVTAVLGKQMGTLKFDLQIRPGGQFLGLLTGCGFVSNTGTYNPKSDLSTRVTKSFEVYEDGLKKVLDGCNGSCKIDYEDGKPITAHFEWSGIWIAPTDAAMPAQAAISTQPYIARSLTITVAAATPAAMNKISVDLGQTVEERESLAAASGIAHYVVTEILPKASLDPEARKVADQDAYGLLLAGTAQAISIAVIGGGHTLTLSAPAAQRQTVNTGTRGKRMTHELEVNLCNSTGDDALSLVEA